uniref:6PF2K domain-containing protein n=1 Tax=Heterorhabditis bacteriophora TaxID=37862 RepID=A0A1I7X7H1_HETBA
MLLVRLFNNNNECARLAIEDMGRYLDSKEGEVAYFKILDATNTTRARRRLLVDFCKRADRDPAFRVFFIESVCDDPDIINSNITVSFETIKNTSTFNLLLLICSWF